MDASKEAGKTHDEVERAVEAHVAHPAKRHVRNLTISVRNYFSCSWLHATKAPVNDSTRLRGHLKLAVLVSGMVVLFEPAESIAALNYHSGSGCERVSGGSRGWWNQGTIGNLHDSETMRVHCPFVRHSSTNASNMVVSGWQAQSNHVVCSGYRVNSHGTSWTWGGWQSSSSVGGYGIVVPPTVPQSHNGYMHIICDIGPRVSGNASTIAMYN